MDAGYVLAHVLEAVVPGHDLGDGPACEVTLGGGAAQCPIPSTLQSENVALPTAGEEDPIVHVQAFDSARRSIGSVVVPVSTLVPLEVWNVWYAMDEGLDDAEERAPEETSKMHLLLQYVPREAAAEETPQLREMRAQDFLLRALQQLNASLEAKVMGHQGASGNGVPAPELGPSIASGFGYPPPYPSTGGFQEPVELAGPPATLIPLPSAAPTGPTETTDSAATLPRPGVLGSMPSAASLSQVAPPSQPSTQPPSPFARQRATPTASGVSGGAVEAAVADAKPTPAQLAQRAQWEEMLKSRVEPYERAIAAYEEKQRLYEDQHARVRELARSLEDREERCRALHAQLDSADAKQRAAVDAEQEVARQAHVARTAMEQQVNELKQEVALRRDHEDSLQKRVALMESELSLVHQKCVMVDSLEEEVQTLKKEAEAQKERRRDVVQQLEEKGREVARLESEASRMREEHSKELLKARNAAREEQKAADQARDELQRCQDTCRDKAAEHALLQERSEDLMRQLSTMENEVSSYRTLLDRERWHRKELEKKFEDQELKRLGSVLDEHRQVVKDLRQEVADLRQELHEERAKTTGLGAELASAQRDCLTAKQQEEEVRQRLRLQDDLQEEVQAVSAKNDELRAKLRAAQEEARKMTDHYERELGEHAKAERSVCEERDERQRQIGELQVETQRCQQRVEELEQQLDQKHRSLAAAHEAAERIQEVQQHLRLSQQECRGHHTSRDELHAEVQRVTARFQEDGFSRDQRAVELEATLDERNNEIKLLMYRVQELSSKYTPARGDHTDTVLAKWVNGYRPAVPFFRLAQGTYLFGRRQVVCKISNDKPVFRVGGGFIGFDKFLELYASEELERLLSYEIDERTGEPKFVEAQRVRQTMEDSGAIDEIRDRAMETQAARGEGLRSSVDRDRGGTGRLASGFSGSRRAAH